MFARHRRRIVSVTLALATIAMLSFNPLSDIVRSSALAVETKMIKVGVDLPLSGGEAASNIPTKNGVLLAIEEANATGLPHGYRVASYVLDDAVEGKHDPAQGAQNVRTFIADPSVLAFVGPANSNVAKAEIPLANDAGLVQIAASTTADGLTRGADAAKLRVAHPDVNSFFRLSTLDSRQGAAGASFAKKLGLSRAFIIDDNETYGKGLADVFEQQFGALGGTILGHEHLIPTQTDFTPLLTKARATGADIIFFGGVSVTGGGLFRRQQVSQGLGKIPLLGGDGLAGGDFLRGRRNGSGWNLLHALLTRRDQIAGGREVRSAIPGPLQERSRPIQRQWVRRNEDHHRGDLEGDFRCRRRRSNPRAGPAERC
jgi:branched-chain amino acid transport system substrate-binding protein